MSWRSRLALTSLLAVTPACVRPAARPPAAQRPSCPLVPALSPTTEFTLGDGRRVKAENGLGYSFEGGGWVEVAELHPPDWFEKNYRVAADCSVSRVLDDGSALPIQREFSDDFEKTADVRTMFSPTPGWASMTLQSPLAPTVQDYVKLRQCIVDGSCAFKDNRIDLREEGGRRHLRLTAVSKGTLVTSKTSIETGLTYALRGDDVKLALKVRLVEGAPFSLLDFESSFVDVGPGPRLVLYGGEGGTPLNLGVEMKFLDKPQFRQSTPVPFPSGRWVALEVRYRLDERAGRIEVWQDGVKVLDAMGQTLALPDVVVDRVEVGVTATDGACVVDIDDVRFTASR